MAIDVSSFQLNNVVDTCAVWNVLSSLRLLQVARSAGVTLVCTRVVIYECLHKVRKSPTDAERELQARLRIAQRNSQIDVYSVELDDLQAIKLMENRKRLGKGELSTIAFAMKTRQAVLTDDQKARVLALQVMANPAQTTPHMFGWLFFTNQFSDNDKDLVIADHKAVGRPLAPFFETAYEEACRCRLMASQAVNPIT